MNPSGARDEEPGFIADSLTPLGVDLRGAHRSRRRGRNRSALNACASAYAYVPRPRIAPAHDNITTDAVGRPSAFPVDPPRCGRSSPFLVPSDATRQMRRVCVWHEPPGRDLDRRSSLQGAGLPVGVSSSSRHSQGGAGDDGHGGRASAAYRCARRRPGRGGRGGLADPLKDTRTPIRGHHRSSPFQFIGSLRHQSRLPLGCIAALEAAIREVEQMAEELPRAKARAAGP